MALAFKAFDFMLAWFVWDGVSAVWAGISGSPCYAGVDGVTGEQMTWALPFILSLVLLACAVWTAAAKESCSPKRLGRWETPAAAWSIVLGTIGIQLGWAIKATFDGLFDLVPTHSEHPAAFDVALMLPAALAVALLVAKDVRKKAAAWRSPRPSAATTVPDKV